LASVPKMKARTKPPTTVAIRGVSWGMRANSFQKRVAATALAKSAWRRTPAKMGYRMDARSAKKMQQSDRSDPAYRLLPTYAEIVQEQVAALFRGRR
jgi:hypothetical protein